MKTSKSIQQIAAHFRATGEKAKSKSFQYTAKEINTEITRQETVSQLRRSILLVTPIREQMQNIILTRLKRIALAIPSSGYSMGSLKKVQFATLSAESDRRSYYAGKHRGSEKFGYQHYKFTIQELIRTKVIAGEVTCFIGEVEPKIFEALVLKRVGNKSSNLEWARCYVTGDYHATTIEDARSWRTRRAKGLLAERDARKVKAEFTKHFHRAKMMFYGFKDSLEAGNCELGSLNFCGDKGLNKDFGYRGDYLLSLGNGRTFYVERMITKRAIELQTRASK
jgi:hypothetical protein